MVPCAVMNIPYTVRCPRMTKCLLITRSQIMFPLEFRVPGYNPEKPGKIPIFPGCKTMLKIQEISGTRNPE